MLATTLPDAEAWVMAGDFNMTELERRDLEAYLWCGAGFMGFPNWQDWGEGYMGLFP